MSIGDSKARKFLTFTPGYSKNLPDWLKWLMKRLIWRPRETMRQAWSMASRDIGLEGWTIATYFACVKSVWSGTGQKHCLESYNFDGIAVFVLITRLKFLMKGRKEGRRIPFRSSWGVQSHGNFAWLLQSSTFSIVTFTDHLDKQT